MKQDRTSNLRARPALVVLALAAAGLLAGCASPLTGMPHDASPVDTDPIAELRQLGEAVVAEPRNADLRARYLARRDALATGWLNEAERARAFAQFEQAERLYRAILDRVPDDETAGVNLALLDAQRGEVDDARARLGRMAARNARSPQVARALAELDAARQ